MMAAFMPIFGREMYEARKSGWDPKPDEVVTITVGFWPGRGWPKKLCLAVPTRRHWSDCLLTMIAGASVQILTGTRDREYAEGLMSMVQRDALGLFIVDLDAAMSRVSRLWLPTGADYINAWTRAGFDPARRIE